MIGENMRKYLYWVFPFIWMTVIFWFSAQPYEKQNIQPYLTEAIDLDFLKPFTNWISFTYNQSEVSVETLGVYGFVEFFVRKGAHVFVFFILCCLFYIALRKTTKMTCNYLLMISFGLTFLYAGFDEFHQGYTENRTSYIGDVFLDGFGGGLAVLFLVAIYILKNRRGSVQH